MKKTVLFSMNVFGVEQLDCYSIYNAKLMPNLDRYTKEYLFSSIETPASNLVSGYRCFSTGSLYPLSYSLIDNYLDKFAENKNFELYLNSINENGKIHIFLSFENDKSVDHLKSFLKFIRSKKTNPIFLHLVLIGNNTSDYKTIERLINKVIYDIKECKIGIVVGKNILSYANVSSFMNLFQNEVGEKWREISRKISSLTSLKTIPANAREFYMNEGFKLDVNDSIFFFNYEYIDLTNLVMAISKVINNDNFFSMFSVKGVKYPMFAYPKYGISMLNSLDKIGAKALIVSNRGSMGVINYYCCGLQNIVSDRISFVKTDNLNFEQLKAIIRDSDYSLVIISYQIDDVKTVPELNDRLSRLDKMLGYIHDFCVSGGYSLFISSLYGMQKELAVDNFVKATVNFSHKVPFVVIDPVFNKANFSLGIGNIYNLAHTIYTNINNKYDGGEVLIRRKSFIVKLLRK